MQHTIMVIEDDHDTRVSLRNSLEEAGFYVFSAANGKDGLELLKRIKPPRLVLLDLLMPIMNGEEFLKEVEGDSTLSLIPVVLISAFPDAAKLVIAQHFVKKPIDLKALISAIKKYCP